MWNKKPVPQQTNDTQKIETVKNDIANKNNEVVKNNEPKDIQQTDSIAFEETAELNENIVLENDNIKLVFSNMGAVIKKVFVKDYFAEDEKTIVQLIPADESLFKTRIESNEIIDTENRMFSHTQIGNKLIFTIGNDTKKIEKIFELNEEFNLKFDLNINLENSIKNYKLDLASGLNDTEDFLKYKDMDYKAVILANNSLSTFKLASIKKAEKKNEKLFNEVIEKISWATLRTKFFMFGIIPEDRVVMNDVTLFTNHDSPAMILTSKLDDDSYQINDSFNIYFGPIIQENLEKYGKDFENSSELLVKWYRPLCKWFNIMLNYINKIIHNFGISIIVFALIIKLFLYPLTHKSFESTQKMKKVQPEMEKLKKQFKGDQKQMQLELNKLYKENGVNPLGGCLPLLFQMPILFSLYPVLRYSIHLRQVGFLWLQDLSAPDTIINLPFNIPLLGSNLGILPILMALFMFLQQKMMTPNTQPTDDMDEKQLASMQSQKMMMYVMPIMMFVFFNNFASGLVLYWTIFNIFSMGQQYLIKKKFEN